MTVWPPMLERAPPMAIGPRCCLTASTISSVVVGVITSLTAMGLSWVTSLTREAGVGCSTGVRITLQTVVTKVSNTTVRRRIATSLRAVLTPPDSDFGRSRWRILKCDQSTILVQGV